MKIPLTTRMYKTLGNIAGRFTNKETVKKNFWETAYQAWEKDLLRRQDMLTEEAKKNKEEAIRVLKEFDKGYVLEDEQGPITEERMQSMTHEELLEVLKYFLKELKRDVGEQ